MATVASAGSPPVVAPRPLLRTSAFAVVSVAFALLAHSTTDHTVPSAWLIAVSTLVVASTARPMAALEHRLPSLFAGLLATQLALHAVFQLQATGRANATAAGWLCCGSDTLPTPAAPAHSGGPLDRPALVQLGVHVLAALVIAAALRVHERNAWSLARRAAARATSAVTRLVAALASVVAVVMPVTGPPARRAQPARSAPSPMRAVLLAARAPRRGPPAYPACGRALHLA